MSFIKDENGQGMLEYVLIIALIAVIAIVALLVVRRIVQNKSNDISNEVSKMETTTP